MALTERQERFVDFYIQLGNASEAARKAGYSEKFAGYNAIKLLKNTKVKTAIDQKLETIKSQRVADAQEVMEYLSSVMRGEKDEEVVVVESVGDFMSEARTIRKQVGIKERNKAAELLAKRYGLQTEKVQLDVKPIIIGGDDDLDE